MSTKTTNYELIKPADNEAADIAVINENYDRIDAALTPAADPTRTPVSNGPGKLAQWVSWTANRIKAISGTSNWYDEPPSNLQAAADHINAVSPHLGHARTSDLTAHLADNTRHTGYAAASGINTYTVSIPGITALAEGLSVKVKFTNANTGASSLNINSLGAVSIQKSNGAALSSGNIKAGQIVHLVYTGLVFQLLGEGGEYGTATAGDVLSGYTIGTEAGVVNGTLALTGDAVAANVLAGKTFYNTNAKTKLTGTMVNHQNTTQTSWYAAYPIVGGLQMTPIPGYYDASSINQLLDNNFIAANIKEGVSIFGLTGTAKVLQFASGTAYSDSNQTITITGLTFQPRLIVVKRDDYEYGQVGSKTYFYDDPRADSVDHSIYSGIGAGYNSGAWTITATSFTVRVRSGGYQPACAWFAFKW